MAYTLELLTIAQSLHGKAKSSRLVRPVMKEPDFKGSVRIKPQGTEMAGFVGYPDAMDGDEKSVLLQL